MQSGPHAPSAHDAETEKLALELAETTDLSPKQARELIARHGNDRDALMKAAKNFKAES